MVLDNCIANGRAATRAVRCAAASGRRSIRIFPQIFQPYVRAASAMELRIGLTAGPLEMQPVGC